MPERAELALRRRNLKDARADLAARIERWQGRYAKLIAWVEERRAYEAFCNWARGHGIEPPTETYFGRQFTKEIALLGGPQEEDPEGRRLSRRISGRSPSPCA